MADRISYATMADWKAEGTRRFGPDMMDWVFVCPCCKFPQSARDFQKAGAKDGSMVGFSCVGRLMETCREAFAKGPGPCNYAGGGLFRVAPVAIAEHPGAFYFDFAPAEQAGS